MKKKRYVMRIMAFIMIVSLQTMYLPPKELLAEPWFMEENYTEAGINESLNDFSCPAHTQHDEFCEYERYGICMHICQQCLAQKSPPEEIPEDESQTKNNDGVLFDFGDENDTSWLDENLDGQIYDIYDREEQESINNQNQEESTGPVKFLITSVSPLDESDSHIVIIEGTTLDFPDFLAATADNVEDTIDEENMKKEEPSKEELTEKPAEDKDAEEEDNAADTIDGENVKKEEPSKEESTEKPAEDKAPEEEDNAADTIDEENVKKEEPSKEESTEKPAEDKDAEEEDNAADTIDGENVKKEEPSKEESTEKPTEDKTPEEKDNAIDTVDEENVKKEEPSKEELTENLAEDKAPGEETAYNAADNVNKRKLIKEELSKEELTEKLTEDKAPGEEKADNMEDTIDEENVKKEEPSEEELTEKPAEDKASEEEDNGLSAGELIPENRNTIEEKQTSTTQPSLDLNINDISQTQKETENIPVQWRCTTEYSGKAGTYIFLPVLPEGYAFADGVAPPEIKVTVMSRGLLSRGGIVGIGTRDNPIQIDSATALYDFTISYNDGSLRQTYGIAKDDLVYVKLTADIDLIKYQSGSGFPPIGDREENPFLGHFDGNGYTVNNMVIKEYNYSQRKCFGLFAVVDQRSIVENLGVRSASVLAYSDKLCKSGIIAGELRGTLRNCYSTGTIFGSGRTGAIVGSVEPGGEIDTVWTIADVRKGGLYNYDETGGIAGVVEASASIKNAIVLSRNVGFGNYKPKNGTFGRIAAYNEGTLENNMVWEGLDYPNDGTGEGEAADEKNGESKNASFLADTANWPIPFQSVPWATQDGSLPYFANSGSVPFSLEEFTGLNLKGGGTKSDPFLIETKEELYHFAREVNKGRSFPDVTFRLQNDIDLGGEEWKPIGNFDSHFSGNFNGGGHKVYNFKINLPNQSKVGFFGNVHGGSITDLGVEECTINGNGDVGALIGYLQGNEVRRCYVKDINVTGADSCVGGLMGYAGKSEISECFAQDIEVKGSYRLGGLVGYTFDNVKISNVYTTGSVTSYAGTTTGGIIGNMNADDGELKNSFTTVNVYYAKSGNWRDFTTVGGISGLTAGYVKNSVCLSQTIDGFHKFGCASISGSAFLFATDPGLYNNKSWEGVVCGGWQQVGNHQRKGELLSAEEIKKTENWGFKDAEGLWEFDSANGRMPRLANVPASVNLDFPSWVSSENLMLNPPANGDGTQNNPYEIATPQNLMWLHAKYNTEPEYFNDGAGTKSFKPKYFIQTADIDMRDYNVEWQGIGNSPKKHFYGNYDGQYHSITGLKGLKGLFDAVSKSIDFRDANSKYYYTAGSGVVKNLAVLDCQFDNSYSSYAAGGIARSTEGAEIENCVVTGTIKGSNAGGIVGNSSNSYISGCYTNAEVEANGLNGSAGGIAGRFTNQYYNNIPAAVDYMKNVKRGMEYCYSTGPVLGNSYSIGYPSCIGGIAGSAGMSGYADISITANWNLEQFPAKIISCYTTSPVYYNKIQNDYNKPAYAGGLVGLVSSSIDHKTGRNALEMRNSVALNPYVIFGGKFINADVVSRTIAGTDEAGFTAIINCSYWKNMSLSRNVSKDETFTSLCKPVNSEWFWYEAAGTEHNKNLSSTLGATGASTDNASQGWNKREFGKLPIRQAFSELQSGELPEHLKKMEGENRRTLEISSEKELLLFRDMVNSGNVPAFVERIELKNDIYLTENWEPMGADVNPFRWEFDGMGHCIMNLTIDKPNDLYVGFIGYMARGTVKNTAFTVNKVTGGKYTGAVIGYIKQYGSNAVTNCAVTSENDRLATHVESTRGDGYAGGIIGGQVSRCPVEYSYVNLNVKGNVAGGIVGYSDGDLANVVDNRYNIAAGSVTGNMAAGGIIGESKNSGTSYNSIAMQKSVLALLTKYSGPIFGIGAFDGKGNANAYWSGMETATSQQNLAYAKPLNGAELKEEKNWEILLKGHSNYLFKAGFLPEIAALEGKYDISFPYYLETEALSKDSQDRFMLATPEDLVTMQKKVGAEVEYTYGKYMLMNDIDMSQSQLSPIGSYSPDYIDASLEDGQKVPYFMGELDGNGKAIQNLKMNSSGSAAGLFAYLGPESKVYNMKLENVNITGSGNTGALAGTAGKNTSVADITVSGSVSGGDNTGGLVGMGYGEMDRITANDLTVKSAGENTGAIAGTLSGTLKDSSASSTVQVTGNDNTGGLAGNTDGSIQASYFIGSVEGNNQTGGIAGVLSGSITKSYMAGSISGADNIGGIAGEMAVGSKIQNAYSVSSISGGSAVGGIAGKTDGTIEYAYSTGGVSGTGGIGGIVGSMQGNSVIQNTAAINSSTKGSRVVGNNSGGSIGNNISWDMHLSIPGDDKENGTVLDKNQYWKADPWTDRIKFDMNKDGSIWEMKDYSLPILAGMKNQDDSLPMHLTGAAIGDLSIKLITEKTDFDQSAAPRTVDISVEYTNFENVSQRDVLWSVAADSHQAEFILANTKGESSQITIPKGFYGKFTITGKLESNNTIFDEATFQVTKTFSDDLAITIMPDKKDFMEQSKSQDVGLTISYINFENEKRRNIVWEIKDASSRKDEFKLESTNTPTNTLTIPGEFTGWVTIGAELEENSIVNTEYMLIVLPNNKTLKIVPDKTDISESSSQQNVGLTIEYTNFGNDTKGDIVWEIKDTSSRKDEFKLKNTNTLTNTLTIPGGFTGWVTIGVELKENSIVNTEYMLIVGSNSKALKITPDKTNISQSSRQQNVSLTVEYMNFGNDTKGDIVWEIKRASSRKDEFKLESTNTPTNTLTIPDGFTGTVTIGAALKENSIVNTEYTLTVGSNSKVLKITPDKTNISQSSGQQNVGLTIEYMNFGNDIKGDIVWEIKRASSRKDEFKLESTNTPTNTLTIPGGFIGTVTIGAALKENSIVNTEYTLTVGSNSKALKITPDKTDISQSSDQQNVGLTVEYINFGNGAKGDIVWEIKDASSRKDEFKLESTNTPTNTLTIPGGFTGTVTISAALKENSLINAEYTLEVKSNTKSLKIVPDKTDISQSSGQQNVGLTVEYVNFGNGAKGDIVWEIKDASSHKDEFKLENTNTPTNTLTIPGGFIGTVTIGAALKENSLINAEYTLEVKPNTKSLKIVPDKTDISQSSGQQNVGLTVEYINFGNETRRDILWEIKDASSHKDEFKLENTNTPKNTITIPGGFSGTVTVEAKWKEDNTIAAHLVLDVRAVSGTISGGGGGSHMRSQSAERRLNGTVDVNGKMTVIVTLNDVNGLLSYVKDNADARFTVGEENTYTSIEYIVESEAVKKLLQSKINSIRFDSLFSYLTIDIEALRKINTGEALHILVNPAENIGMWSKLLLSGNPVYEFSLFSENGGDKTEYHHFSPGKVEIGIYFTEKPGKEYRMIYIDENKTPAIEEDSKAGEGTVSVKKESLSVYGVAEKKVSTVFDDIEGHWAEKIIQEISETGLMAGMGERTFEPEIPMTRAMFITVLARLSGYDLSGYTNDHYSDVEGGSYYETAVAWASDKGIVSGIGDGRFEPNRELTREEMAVILDKFLEVMEISLEMSEKTDFADMEDVSLWARESVLKLYKSGYLNGKSGNLFDPKGRLKRCEAASAIMAIVKQN